MFVFASALCRWYVCCCCSADVIIVYARNVHCLFVVGGRQRSSLFTYFVERVVVSHLARQVDEEDLLKEARACVPMSGGTGSQKRRLKAQLTKGGRIKAVHVKEVATTPKKKTHTSKQTPVKLSKAKKKTKGNAKSSPASGGEVVNDNKHINATRNHNSNSSSNNDDNNNSNINNNKAQQQ